MHGAIFSIKKEEDTEIVIAPILLGPFPYILTKEYKRTPYSVNGAICSQLQIIFRKRATKYRSLLRKMTYKDSSLGQLLTKEPHILSTEPYLLSKE